MITKKEGGYIMKRKFFALMLCLFLSFVPVAGAASSADDGIAPCYYFEDEQEAV